MPTLNAAEPVAPILDPMMRHVEPSPGAIGETRMFVKRDSVDEVARTIDFVCSSDRPDRYGEIVEPSAFKASLDTFMQNPVFPAGHQYDFRDQQTPTVGHWKAMRVEGNKLIGKAWFKDRGLGQECWLDYIEGNLNTVSVGFIARGWELRELEIDGKKCRVRVFVEADLLECSAVLIPANPEARIRAAAAPVAAGMGAGDAFDQRIERAVERTMKRLLSVGLDAPMRQYVRDVLAVAGVGGPDPYEDIPDDDDPPPSPADPDAGDDGLKHLLRDTLTAKAGGAAL